MPQSPTPQNPMSLYETYSLVLSVIALALSVLIPLTQYLFRKLQRPHLKVIPFDIQPLSLHYDMYGSYARFKFSIQCERDSCIVKSIRLKIRNMKSKQQYSSKWIQLKPIYTNWMFAGAQQATIGGATLVHPIKIEADKLEPLNVEFKAYRRSCYAFLTTKACKSINCLCQSIETVEDILSEQSVSQSIDGLAESCLWSEGDYTAELIIDYDSKGSLSSKYRFNVDKDQAALLQRNATALVSTLIPETVTGNRKTLQVLQLDIEGFQG